MLNFLEKKILKIQQDSFNKANPIPKINRLSFLSRNRQMYV